MLYHISGKQEVEGEKMKAPAIALVAALLLICLIGCKAGEKKPDEPTAEETAVEALPENIGDKTAPTAIKALKGAKEVRKRMDAQREKDSKVLEETNR